jgi:hypothetical protein
LHKRAVNESPSYSDWAEFNEWVVELLVNEKASRAIHCKRPGSKESRIMQPLALLIFPVDRCAGLCVYWISLTNLYLKFG